MRDNGSPAPVFEFDEDHSYFATVLPVHPAALVAASDLRGDLHGQGTTGVSEIGWHLARRFWGKGYASEAARAVLRYGFVELNLSRIVAVMELGNGRSSSVARRIGMQWLGKTRQ